MKPYEVIAQLEATSGRLDKERIVLDAWNQGCVEFFQGAKLAYDALITFGVKKVPLIEGEDDGTFVYNLEWSEFTTLLDRLRTRELSGNAARDALRSAADAASAAQWNGWYRRILLKDFKCGITESTINKVLESVGGKALDYIIPVFSCQLAKNGEDHPKKIAGKKFLDPKLDGVRILTILNIENQTVTQYTRDGRQNDRFELIATSFAKLLPFLKQSIVFDGEVVSRSFQELMRQLNRKKETNTADAKLALFDVIPLADFLAGECKLTQTECHELLVGFMPLFAEHCGERVYVIPKMLVDLNTPEGQQQFKEFNRETVDAGFEGIMIKDPKSTYRTKRTDAWLKIKPFITVDLEIVGFEPGKSDSRFRDTLGGMICRGEDQGKKIEVTVGSGFSEDLRDEIWRNQDKVLGQIAEIKGDALTKSKDSEDVWSLRFPSFVQFRDDKHA